MPRSFHLFEIFDICAKFGFCATVIINVVFINITMTYIKRIPKSYKRMLITFALICIFFAIIELLARPCIHNFNGAVMYFSLNGDEFFSRKGSQSILLFYGGCYCSLIAFICVQFVFRFASVTNHPFQSSFSGKPVILWAFYVAGVGLLYSMMIQMCVQPVKYSDDYMRDEILLVYGRDINATARFISVAYVNGLPSWSGAMFLASETGILSSQYLIIIFCALKMHKAIKNDLDQFSSSNRKLEKQFYYALLVQILLPTLLLNLPCGIVLSIPLLETKISCQSGVIYALFSMYPPLDSFATMMIVTEYRKCFKECFKDFKEAIIGRSKASEENSNVHGPNPKRISTTNV